MKALSCDSSRSVVLARWLLTRVHGPNLETRIGVDLAASIRKNLAANLQRLMEARGLKQIDIAERLGIAPSIVNKWLHAKSLPEEKNIDLLVAKFGWTFEELVRNPDPGKTKPNDREIDRVLKQLAVLRGFKLIENDESE